MIFGADSANAVTSGVIDQITTAITKPTFWGRYLSGAYAFDAGERALLWSKGIRILPIYNGTTDHSAALNGTTADGTNDAQAALAAASAQSVPSGTGIALYADIEGSYLVSGAWLSGWVQGVQGGGYVAGIYCGTDKSGITDAYSQISHDDRVSLLIWSNAPCFDAKNHWSVSGMPTAMQAVPMSAGGGIHVPNLWQYAMPLEGEAQIADLDICDGDAYDAMWAPPG